MARLGRSQPFKPLIRRVRGTVSFSTFLTETVTATDTAVRSTARTFAESMTVTDVFAGMRIFLMVLDEIVTVADSITRSIARALSDTVTAADAVVKSIMRSLLETVTATDTFSKMATFVRTFVETLTVTDVIKVLRNGSGVFWTHITKSADATFTKISKSVTSWTHIDRN